MIDNNSAITIKEFVEKLTAGGGENPPPADCVEYGLRCGWLDAQDAENPEQTVLRKNAARIIHNFLRLALSEADEIDSSPAYVLQDLFDCRVCAGHIIQVYVKGIMDGILLSDGRMIFAADRDVSEKETEEIVARVFHREDRTSRVGEPFQNKTVGEPEEITLEQAMQLLKHSRRILLVDVRTEREYEQKHLPNARNVPLMSIIKNPFVFSEKRDKMILLYCGEGYQSKAATQCLLEAGYSEVAYFSWK